MSHKPPKWFYADLDEQYALWHDWSRLMTGLRCATRPLEVYWLEERGLIP